MAGKQQKQKQGGGGKEKPPSAGKRKVKTQEYFTSARLAERTIRRILRHSGFKSAQLWANLNGAISNLRRIMTPEFEKALAIRGAKSATRALAAKQRRWERRCQRNPKLAG